MSGAITQKITEKSLAKFKALVRYSINLSPEEKRTFQQIPDTYFENIFRELYHADYDLAKSVITNRISKIDKSDAIAEIEAIKSLTRTAQTLTSGVELDKPILFISDVDNDGALALALALEFKRITDHEIYLSPKIYQQGDNGFSVEQIRNWQEKEQIEQNDFIVVVSDLGTNQRQEQELFHKEYPKANLIIVDHHKPDVDKKIDNTIERVDFLSPYVAGGAELALKNGGGISASYLMYTLLRKTIENLANKQKLTYTDVELKVRLEPMEKMAEAGNMLDMVECDVRLKPLDVAEANKALTVNKTINKGRAIGFWCSDIQIDRINALMPMVGQEGVEYLLSCRHEYLKQNQKAKVLFSILPQVLSSENEKSVSSLYLEGLKATPIEAAYDQNYTQLLKSYFFDLNYEQQLDKVNKTAWLNYVEDCFKEIGCTDRKIVNFIKENKLVNQLIRDFVVIKQPVNEDVSLTFTTNQLSSALNNDKKTLELNVSYVDKHKICFLCRSELSIYTLVNDLKKEFSFASFDYIGHDKAGALTMVLNGIKPKMALEYFVNFVDEFLKKNIDVTVLNNTIESEITHLPFIFAVNNLTRSSFYNQGDGQLHPLLVLDKNVVLEDSKTLKKILISEIAKEDPNGTVSIPLDFARETKFVIPNQAILAIVNSDYKAKLKVTQISENLFLANKVISERQSNVLKLPKLNTTLDRDRDEIKKFYQKHFHQKDNVILNVSRREAMDALKFTGRNKEAFYVQENIALGLMNKVNADCYAVLDVEADGVGNAQCFNIGLTLFEKKNNSGVKMSKSDFERLIKENPEKIQNVNRQTDDQIVVNEKTNIKLISFLISDEGGQPITISSMSQFLTNITPELLKSLNASADDVQKAILTALADYKKIIFQAHNLPYDNNIVRVNFPEMYQLMSNSIHIDSAILARELQIGYVNILVSEVEKTPFVDAFHEGYNLTTVLSQDKDNVDFPSLKGDKTIQARGDELFMLNNKTQQVTKIKDTRSELLAKLPNMVKKLSQPKYGIAMLLRMATIKDMVMQKPVAETIYHKFDGLGVVDLDPKLWKRFQDNYAYDLSLENNINKFLLIPDVKLSLQKSKTFKKKEDRPNFFVEAIEYGRIVTPKTTKKALEAMAKEDMCASGEKIFKANAMAFVKKNPKNIERYSCAWVYDLVLNHYESSRKTPDNDLIIGLSERLGVPSILINEIFNDCYKYREHRGLTSYKVHETHNNIGLDGDAFQESFVYTYMLNETTQNPYVPCLQYQPTLDLMIKQMVRSSLKQEFLNWLSINLDDDKFNTSSRKQLINFSDEGVSAKHNIGQNPFVNFFGETIELLNFNQHKFLKLPVDEQELWLNKLEFAIKSIILSNSINGARGKKLSDNERNDIISLVTSPKVIENLKEVENYFGQMNANKKVIHLKKICKAISQAIVGDEDLKLPKNNTVLPSEIDFLKSSVCKILEVVKEKLFFEPYIKAFELDAKLENLKEQYKVAQEKLQENGNDDKLQLMLDAAPSLVATLDKKVNEPLKFMLSSGDGKTLLIDQILVDLSEEVEPDLLTLEQKNDQKPKPF